MEKDYRSEINALRGKLSRLKDLYLNELLTMDEYKKDYASITEKIHELEIKQQPPRPSNLPQIQKLLSHNWRDMYGAFLPCKARILEDHHQRNSLVSR